MSLKGYSLSQNDQELRQSGSLGLLVHDRKYKTFCACLLFRILTPIHWWLKLSFWLLGGCRRRRACTVLLQHAFHTEHALWTAHSNVAYCGCASSFPTFYSQPPREKCKRLSWQIWVLLHAPVTPGFAERSLPLGTVVCRVVLSSSMHVVVGNANTGHYVHDLHTAWTPSCY